MRRTALQWKLKTKEKTNENCCAQTGIFHLDVYKRQYGNNRMLIKEWIGQTGKVVFEDNMVSSGASYRYSVVPEHPELSVNGKQVCGPVKKTALVQVGEAEIILNDIEFSGDG